MKPTERSLDYTTFTNLTVLFIKWLMALAAANVHSGHDHSRSEDTPVSALTPSAPQRRIVCATLSRCYHCGALAVIVKYCFDIVLKGVVGTGQWN